jgi:hypothetical protein
MLAAAQLRLQAPHLTCLGFWSTCRSKGFECAVIRNSNAEKRMHAGADGRSRLGASQLRLQAALLTCLGSWSTCMHAVVINEIWWLLSV